MEKLEIQLDLTGKTLGMGKAPGVPSKFQRKTLPGNDLDKSRGLHIPNSRELNRDQLLPTGWKRPSSWGRNFGKFGMFLGKLCIPEVGKMDPTGIPDGGSLVGLGGHTGREHRGNSAGMSPGAANPEPWDAAPKIPGMSPNETHTPVIVTVTLLGTRASHEGIPRIPGSLQDPARRSRNPGIPAGVGSAPMEQDGVTLG